MEPQDTPPAADGANPRIQWKVDGLKSSYVNFANANSTQEEVVLNFGMNNNWDRMAAEVEIELTHRIVMSPFAAKRLSELLGRLVSQYEGRYGPLK
ncbi:DUF3467 domain-containing protein [uncultured Pseudacidovorax sp.]|jgi:hypothetical protein|uniref:DUF3467 domain-containing protein n=1 Tax=uncultured Pseudacidovorax sp. TaxID=679313 RepID=UPI0025E0253B|nr:DUF3467 domain-containing protein [uncultured Pseudacidovorax sp.]